jgi:hypothetical protein
MEPTQREIVAGFGERASHLHYFAGSGIPKRKGAKTKVLNGLAFYPSEVAKSYGVNEKLAYHLKIKNEFAGHRVPTGDPERFFSISFELSDEAGKVLAQKKDRIGEQWEWYPEAKKLADNNLNPGEERTFAFAYQPKQKQKLTLAVKVTKNRLDPKSAEYNKLTDQYPLSITVFDEKYVIEVK